jgi:hypothetical protein
MCGHVPDIQYIVTLSEYCLFVLSDPQLKVGYAHLLD